MWTYDIVDTLTGAPLFPVTPAPGGTWGRMTSDQGAGKHLLPMTGSALSAAQWKDATQPWARTLVVSWGGVAKYAGLFLTRDHDRQKNAIEVQHKELRVILGRRFFHDINGYSPTLVMSNVNQTLRGLAAGAVRRALVTGGGEQWRLPVVVPEPEAGPFSRTYHAYEFTTAESMLDEIETLDNGPDVDFEPRWRADGKLEWLMRIGSPRFTDVPQFEFPMNVDEPKVFDVKKVSDGTEMLTGLLAIGKGAEQDIRVGKGLSVAGPVVPFLDSSQSFKEIDDVAALNMHATGEVRARRNPTEQWELKIRTDSFEGGTDFNFARLRLGTTIRLRFDGDAWEDDGNVDLYTIAYYGDGTDTITLDVQDAGRIT